MAKVGKARVYWAQDSRAEIVDVALVLPLMQSKVASFKE